jgi:hypothetical protein
LGQRYREVPDAELGGFVRLAGGDGRRRTLTLVNQRADIANGDPAAADI